MSPCPRHGNPPGIRHNHCESPATTSAVKRLMTIPAGFSGVVFEVGVCSNVRDLELLLTYELSQSTRHLRYLSPMRST